MTRRIQMPAAMIAAVAAAASLTAQQRPADAPSSTVTVTGCVQRIDESGSLGTTIPERTPTPEQAGIAANSGEPGLGFMLVAAAPPNRAKTARGNAPVSMRYVLVADAAELAQYQGQRVRAQGTLAAVPTKPAESAPVGTSGSVQFQSNAARLNVTSIERIAASCK
jgi:hypothetical protein